MVMMHKLVDFRQRGLNGKAKADGQRITRAHDRVSNAVPAPEANAEIKANLEVGVLVFCLLYLNCTSASDITVCLFIFQSRLGVWFISL